MAARNIKTTVSGVLGFVALALDAVIGAVEAGHFDGKSTSQIIAAVAVLLIGLFSRDYNVTSEGTVIKSEAPASVSASSGPKGQEL